jgi:hypothetical protein
MNDAIEHVPGVTDDPIIQYILRGEAQSLHEAEEMYLDAAMPQIIDLLESGMSHEELGRHPLFRLMLSHGSRPWEDSLL